MGITESKIQLNNTEITTRNIHNHKLFCKHFYTEPRTYHLSEKNIFLYASYINLDQKYFHYVPECQQDITTFHYASRNLRDTPDRTIN